MFTTVQLIAEKYSCKVLIQKRLDTSNIFWNIRRSVKKNYEAFVCTARAISNREISKQGAKKYEQHFYVCSVYSFSDENSNQPHVQ